MIPIKLKFKKKKLIKTPLSFEIIISMTIESVRLRKQESIQDLVVNPYLVDIDPSGFCPCESRAIAYTSALF